MNWLNALISEGDGQPSTMRVATLGIIALILVPKAIVYTKTFQPQPITEWETALIASVLGLKAWQRGKEAVPAPAT